MTDNVKRELLRATLELTVPQWQQEIKKHPDYYFAQKDKLAVAIGSEGDSILYRSENTAQNFNKLALGIALMSFSVSGITIFGTTFKANMEV